jgi:hypothetical protein
MERIAKSVREDWLLHLVLLIYVVLIFIVVLNHEQWADEAQAWLLARDSSLFGLLFKNMRYEGHPPLWHLILMLPSRLLPYRAISIISVLIAGAAVYILLHYSSFPKIVKILLPFTYFFFYQYAVVARNYVLVPILLFLIARIYRNKIRKVYHFTILVCLLANTTVFATLVALSIIFIHMIDLIRMTAELDRKLIIKQITAYAIFAAVTGLLVIQLWQPADGSFAVGYEYDIHRILKVSSRAFNDSMTEVGYVTIFVLIISLIWFWQNRLLLLYLLSTLAILALFSVKYYNDWHQGIVFSTWVFVMWLSFQNKGGKRLKRLVNWGRKMAILSILLVMGFQVYWAVTVSISDLRGSYSGGEAVANYIKENGLENKNICATKFWITAIQPYFSNNIFRNINSGENPAFWRWSKNSGRIEDMNAILETQPDLIIMSRPGQDPEELEGYRFEGIFEGNLYWKNRIKEKNHFGLFRKVE